MRFNWIILPSLLLVSACTQVNVTNLDPDDFGVSTTPATPAKFTADVKPILKSSCALSGCHAGASPAAMLSLDSDSPTLFADVSAKVTANNADASELVTKGTAQESHTGGEALKGDNLAKVKSWINDGATDN